MKRSLLVIAVLTWMLPAMAQRDSSGSGFGGFFKKVLSGSGSRGNSLSTEEIIAGLKEALTVGAQNSTSKLSVADGFLKDAAVKILLPEEVKKVELRLRALGFGAVVDQAITSLNRAAEDASKTASPIFVNAIRKMTLKDGLSILKGSDTAATVYLKNATTNDLTNAFRPVVETSLKKVNATKYWKDLFTIYNRLALVPVTTDINEYVTSRALRGIFYYVGEEERRSGKIRRRG